MLSSLEEWLGLIKVFVTTTFLDVLELVEDASSPFFCNLATHLNDFVGFLAPRMSSVDIEPLCFSAQYFA